MIKVAGCWELSWNTPIKEAELWTLVLREWQVKEWYMHPISGIKPNESRIVNLNERKNLKEILEENKDLTKVFVEPYNPTLPNFTGADLRDFKHPENVLYIFGSVGFNPVIGFKKEEDIGLTIPTLDNKGVMWPHQILAILLYDRLILKA